jgi:hypothetical protein
MPNNKDYLMDENDVPGNWTDSPRMAKGPLAAPAPPAPNPMPNFFDGSLAPQIQQNVNYVGTTPASPQIPKYSLMPQGIQGSPITNAAIQSTAKLTSKTTPVTPSVFTEEISVNVQSGTSYLVQSTDLDTVVSMNNNSGGTVYLPPFNAPGVAPANTTTAFSPSSGLSITQSITPTVQINQGDTIFVCLLAQPTVGLTIPVISSITDSDGNVYQLGAPNFYVDLAGRNDLVICYSTIASANITTSDTLTITIDFAASATPQNIVSFSVSGYYGKLGSEGDNGSVVGGTFSAGTAIITTEETFYLSVVGSTNTSSTSTFTAIEQGGGGDQIGVAYFYGEGSIIDDWTGSGFYADSLIAYQAPLPGSAVAALTPGFFFYLENTGTGTFTAVSGADIDGIAQSVTVGPNQGLLFVWNGTGWYTVRGLGISKAITSINGDTTPAQSIVGADGITVVTTPGGLTTIGQSSSGEPTVPFWGYPDSGTFVALNPTNTITWNSSPQNGAANKIIMFPFFMPFEMTGLGTISIVVLHADASNQYDFGIYKDVSGQPAWICSTGPQTISSTSTIGSPTKITIANLSGSPIPAGLNYFAMTSAGTGTLGLLCAYDVWRSPWQYQDTSVGTGAWLSTTVPSTGSALIQATLTFGGTPTFLVNDSVATTPVFSIGP